MTSARNEDSCPSPDPAVPCTGNGKSNFGASSTFVPLWQAPKIIVVGPKLIFSFTVAQRLISLLERSWDPNNAAALRVAKGKAAA